MDITPEELKEYALTVGATDAEVINTSLLDVREAARHRCYIPLWYGSSVMCPPHNPLTPDKTRKIVEEYSTAILLRVEHDPHDFAGDEWVERHREPELQHKDLVGKVESKAFHAGYPLTMGFAAGECSYCLPDQECAVLEGEQCRHALKARPSMEACGFDVFSIAHKVGWDLTPIGADTDPNTIPCAALIGLILLE